MARTQKESFTQRRNDATQKESIPKFVGMGMPAYNY